MLIPYAWAVLPDGQDCYSDLLAVALQRWSYSVIEEREWIDLQREKILLHSAIIFIVALPFACRNETLHSVSMACWHASLRATLLVALTPQNCWSMAVTRTRTRFSSLVMLSIQFLVDFEESKRWLFMNSSWNNCNGLLIDKDLVVKCFRIESSRDAGSLLTDGGRLGAKRFCWCISESSLRVASAGGRYVG